MRKTQGIKLHPGGRIENVEHTLPDLAVGHAIIEVTDSAVCGGDVDKANHKFGFNEPELIGHEFAGRVMALGDPIQGARRDNPFGEPLRGIKVGDLVVGWLHNAGLSRHVVAETRNLVRVPKTLSLRYPSIWGEPFSCMVGAVRQANIDVGDDVLCVGMGFMNLVGLAVAAASPARHVIAAARRQDALDLAEQMGANQQVQITRDTAKFVSEVQAITGEHLPKITIEGTGAGDGLRLAREVTREHGTVVVAGYHTSRDRMPDGTQTQTAPGIRWHDEERANFKALRVIAGHFRNLDTIVDNMTAGLRLLESGKINTAAIEDRVTEVPFDQHAIQDALDAAVRRDDGYIKLVVRY